MTVYEAIMIPLTSNIVLIGVLTYLDQRIVGVTFFGTFTNFIWLAALQAACSCKVRCYQHLTFFIYMFYIVILYIEIYSNSIPAQEVHKYSPDT